MELEKIDYVLESLLFLSGDPLSISAIADSLEFQKSEVRASIKRLKEKYSGDCGIHLIEYNGKIQFSTNPKYEKEVTKILSPIREKELSNAIMETVSIIAYRQPVTKLEVESIRGVNCDYAMQALLKYNLIEIVGKKDSIGHPNLYGTTDEFLKRFRIEKIEDLPDYNELIEKIQQIATRDSQVEGLYNEFEIPDEQPPEFLEGEDAQAISAPPVVEKEEEK
ncbi:MAG: SMC-Scp complex subunit ScpB [Clostridia bacterium]|nr:SMC-Scp complex subunit ScpB [Clostridia bacterium]MBP5593241.1 SMC-Scp complex subunit ScpB [Clostridia bacterium]